LFIGGEIHLAIVIVIVSYYDDVDAMVLFIVIVFCVNWPLLLKYTHRDVMYQWCMYTQRDCYHQYWWPKWTTKHTTNVLLWRNQTHTHTHTHSLCLTPQKHY